MIVSFEARGENWSPRRLASLIAKRQSSGEDARCLLAPSLIEVNLEEGSDKSCVATRQSSSTKQVKNHIKANRQALKERQRINKSTAIEEELQKEMSLKKIEKNKNILFGKIKPRVCSHGGPRMSQPDDLQCHLDGQSSFFSHESKNIALGTSEYCVTFGSKIPTSSVSMIRPKTDKRLPNADTSHRHKSYGKIPSYIKNRKAIIEQKEQERLILERNAPPAPGLVLMEESERLETLRLLEENEKKEKDALRNIPFSMNALRATRIKEAIEFRLKEIDDAKRIFSKDRVFVQAN